MRRQCLTRPSLRAFISEHDNNPLRLGASVANQLRGASVDGCSNNCNRFQGDKVEPDDDLLVNMMEIHSNNGIYINSII